MESENHLRNRDSCGFFRSTLGEPAPSFRATGFKAAFKHMKIDARTGLLAFGMFLSTSVFSRANFAGTDSLANPSSNWQFNVESGSPLLQHQNSRLEFLVNIPEASNQANYLWLPNTGAYQSGWFVQTEVHLNKILLPNNSSVNLGIRISGNETNFCSHLMQRGKFVGIDQSGFIVNNSGFPVSGKPSTASNATLRIHYDPTARVLIGSVLTGSKWTYFSPVPVHPWKMSGTDTFRAMLVAGNSGETSGGLAVTSGAAYFRNFRAGSASPEIGIRRVAGSELTDGDTTTKFGGVLVGKSSTKIYEIRNDGTAPLRKLRLVIDGKHAEVYHISSGLGSSELAPGASQRFKVRFSPTSKGIRQAKLHVLSNDKDEPSFDIGLYGQGKR